ncbi:inositol-tetrakisphosphate 1-kinase 1-like isoform X3 [Cucurbita moschata]|uniref:Inositol-tetrakisphosphate 1-kinase n=1 Tax=Cucurbita moschata TaxID=3662 RepID=A0A6J1G5K0_CUCMO|nr:inositol-tetrakisphosphate 1-kinase 1-like isoform X2 [Cucurbita moschata]XP_022947123.1 inositol-tetrakisphosphate 1-kinase 1-like isoform X3 [Cucurbita moschata]
MASSSSSSSSSSSDGFRVGYAFPPNKERNVIRPSLIDYAKLHGVDLVRIDLQSPILHQGPFHCIIHKMYDDAWVEKLQDFALKNPDVVVVDRPDRIERLYNRVSMLDVVSQVKVSDSGVKIEVPKQVVLNRKDGVIDLIRDLEVKFPVIAKPLESNGSAKSHEMSLVYNRRGFKDLETPVLLQEFVNHGGVMFKVYVAGEQSVCVKRKSLPDVVETEEELEKKTDGAMKFSQISRAEEKSEKCNCGRKKEAAAEEEIEMPPEKIVTEVSRGLREAMGIRLFNFDMIRDRNGTYYVIDINYLPGFAVLPDYEAFLTKFFNEVMQKKVEEEENSAIEEEKAKPRCCCFHERESQASTFENDFCSRVLN